jgi:hypothetical protein
MYRLEQIKPLKDFILECYFNNGTKKNVDLKPFLDKEAFLPLKEPGNFDRVINKSYFVEWLGLDIDLSADTLWHIGV